MTRFLLKYLLSLFILLLTGLHGQLHAKSLGQASNTLSTQGLSESAWESYKTSGESFIFKSSSINHIKNPVIEVIEREEEEQEHTSIKKIENHYISIVGFLDYLLYNNIFQNSKPNSLFGKRFSHFSTFKSLYLAFSDLRL